ncbi:hypothetical protein EYZ11_011013 [Aspergillus tanneri]|uniref:Secreted protein n=1 Tax=Aspergillus tanneri TaxID=1220188 RepID=A0A4S3J3W1_9EURO|nr:hypothetical protein EYZ11_011013 [Aspergillus tanneri]
MVAVILLAVSAGDAGGIFAPLTWHCTLCASFEAVNIRQVIKQPLFQIEGYVASAGIFHPSADS